MYFPISYAPKSTIRSDNFKHDTMTRYEYEFNTIQKNN